jgi:AraC-like DNA-binding protein
MQLDAININIFNILILCATIQGLIFGFAVLFWNKFKSKSNFYLAQVILYLSLNNLFYWFADSGIGFKFQYFYNLYIPWIILVLPYYYFFVASYLRKKVSKKTILLLKLPFVFSLSIHVFLSINKIVLNNYFIISDEFIQAFYIGEEYISAIITFGIIIMVFRLIKDYDNTHKEYSINKLEIDTKWLKKILYSGILITSIWLLLVVYNSMNSQDFFSNNGKYFLWGSVSVLIYWMGYLGIYHNGIFRERKIIREETVKLIDKKQKTTKLSFTRFSEIDNYIKSQKLFLNPNLNLLYLQEEFDLSEGYISQLINEFSKNNFSTYINKLRIDQAKLFLQNNEYENYTIVSIALESGFNSKSSFYNAFKKEIGVSPTEFRNKFLS